MGSTMGQFIEMIIREHYEKGEKKMIEKGRTLAFQVSEELFQKVKEYLAWYEKTYHRRLTQNEFVIGLIEEALDEMEAEMELSLIHILSGDHSGRQTFSTGLLRHCRSPRINTGRTLCAPYGRRRLDRGPHAAGQWNPQRLHLPKPGARHDPMHR